MNMAPALQTRRHLARGKVIVGIIRWSLTALICFIILFPLWWIFISSITPASELYTSPIHYLPLNPDRKSVV